MIHLFGYSNFASSRKSFFIETGEAKRFLLLIKFLFYNKSLYQIKKICGTLVRGNAAIGHILAD